MTKIARAEIAATPRAALLRWLDKASFITAVTSHARREIELADWPKVWVRWFTSDAIADVFAPTFPRRKARSTLMNFMTALASRELSTYELALMSVVSIWPSEVRSGWGKHSKSVEDAIHDERRAIVRSLRRDAQPKRRVPLQTLASDLGERAREHATIQLRLNALCRQP